MIEFSGPSFCRIGWGAIAAVLFTMGSAGSTELGAQGSDSVAVSSDGRLTGEVIDALTAQPIAGATVHILRRRAGALGGKRVESAIGISRRIITNSLGTYTVFALPPGTYDVRAQRVGYEPVTIQVELRESARARVSVGLEVIPVRLQPVETHAPRLGGYSRQTRPNETNGAERVESAQMRQREYLGADVREITHADVVEAVTLAETDVFRTFQRMPGVATRDEYSAELWVRGSRWDHTRVYFDGLPMLNPLHAVGGISGIGPDAVGAAQLHPGVRPASIGEGAAAVLDIRSRPGSGDGKINGVSELSVVSARLALDQQTNDGRTAWMVAARRSYIDWLTGAIGNVIDDPSVKFPYGFGGVTARVDHQIDRLRSIEASAIVEQNKVSGDLPDIRHGNRAIWGNAGARVSFLTPVGPFMLRQSVGFSRFIAAVRVTETDSLVEDEFDSATEPPMDGTLSSVMVTGVFDKTIADRTGLMFGYDLVSQRAKFDGATEQIVAGDISDDRVQRSETLRYASTWGQWRTNPYGNIEVEAGLRLDIGAAMLNASVVRPSPRLNVRFRLDSSTTVTAAAGRSFQYAQSTWRTDRHIQSQILPIRLWLLAGTDNPALRTDIATLGAERWVARGVLATMSVFGRRMEGVILPDPVPGLLIDRSLYAIGSERAEGIEAGIRKMTGRVTGSVSYSFVGARIHANGQSFDSPSLRRHTVDMAAMFRATTRFQFGGAFSSASGAPYTRFDPGQTTRDENGDRSWLRFPRAYQPGGEIGAPHRALDLVAQWDFRVVGIRATLFTQIQNALGRRQDASLYQGYEPCDSMVMGPGGVQECVGRDKFIPGLPRLPIIGLRASF